MNMPYMQNQMIWPPVLAITLYATLLWGCYDPFGNHNIDDRSMKQEFAVTEPLLVAGATLETNLFVLPEGARARTAGKFGRNLILAGFGQVYFSNDNGNTWSLKQPTSVIETETTDGGISYRKERNVDIGRLCNVTNSSVSESGRFYMVAVCEH